MFHWDWADLSKNRNWYQDVIMPAYRKFRRRKDEEDEVLETRSEDPGEKEMDTLDALLGQVSVCFNAISQTKLRTWTNQTLLIS